MGKTRLNPLKKKTLPSGAPAEKIYAVISNSLLSIDQALVDNDAVRQSFRTVHDSTLSQYEADLAEWNREIARFPPTLEQYEKLKAAERAMDAQFNNTVNNPNHSLAFHLQKPDDGRDILAVNNNDDEYDDDEDMMGGGTLDDVPLSFQQSAIDSRYPSPTTDSRRGPKSSNLGGAGGSVVSKKLSKAEKEEKKAWDTYEKFVVREDLFSKMANIQAMEKEIETRLQSEGLTDMERKGLERELDRTSVRYSNYILQEVSSYKPRLTAVKVGKKAEEDLGDLSYLGVGMGSIKEMMSAMEESYYAAEEGGDDGDGGMMLDDDDGIYDDDDYDDEDYEEPPQGSYDMPDPQAWLAQQQGKQGRSASPTSQPLSGVEQADAAFDELNAFVSNAMEESERVAVNDPFHFTNMQDLPAVRPSAPDPGNNERNNRSRGGGGGPADGEEEGGRASPGLRDLIQSNTNHVDPYFPSLESFKTKEQDNAAYFMPGFQGKNFFKGVPQSAGAYWTAGRARTREEKRKGKKKKRKGKKKRGRKGKNGNREFAEEGGEGEEGEGEEGESYGDGFDDEGDGAVEEEGEMDEEALKMKKWKEDMKKKYKDWTGEKQEGEDYEDYGEEFEDEFEDEGDDGGEEDEVVGGEIEVLEGEKEKEGEEVVEGEEKKEEEVGVTKKPLSKEEIIQRVKDIADELTTSVMERASKKLEIEEPAVGGEAEGGEGKKERKRKTLVVMPAKRVLTPKTTPRGTVEGGFTERLLAMAMEQEVVATSFVNNIMQFCGVQKKSPEKTLAENYIKNLFDEAVRGFSN
ncbi:hypothetical protein TrCOL_g11932 [Triparma columacea]|uniref:Uncharacterized protein n=1 Tax=Triparma columacea TaxID=722753 RepID=A0A9W7GM23_9STRA|nr:hypothetical protein TrCOL_g11932 [Triparma columacea]